MSTRRKAGDVVRRAPNSGFLGSVEPEIVKILPADDDDPCPLGCGDPMCREWPNVEVVDGEFKGEWLYHISECEMSDV